MSSVTDRYFPEITPSQSEKFARLASLYAGWNDKINVISRKDIENFGVNHLLHSLAIARFISFAEGSDVIDIGTGGGLPGIPLAIMFPHVSFTLVDSIAKKIKVASSIAESLELNNVRCLAARSEDIRGSYDFVVCRAVTEMSRFISLTQHLIGKRQNNTLPNGYICLKGGELSDELAPFEKSVIIENISKWFPEPFFETKKIVYLPFDR